jgi:Ca2+-binding RTX toxin-like protein
MLVGGHGDDSLDGGSGDNALFDRSWKHHSHKPFTQHWFNHSKVNLCASWVKDFVDHARADDLKYNPNSNIKLKIKGRKGH